MFLVLSYFLSLDMDGMASITAQVVWGTRSDLIWSGRCSEYLFTMFSLCSSGFFFVCTDTVPTVVLSTVGNYMVYGIWYGWMDVSSYWVSHGVLNMHCLTPAWHLNLHACLSAHFLHAYLLALIKTSFNLAICLTSDICYLTAQLHCDLTQSQPTRRTSAC